MARQVIQKTIGQDGGRDAAKVFVITEMAARPAHAWATRAIFAMLNSGAELPDNLIAMGVAGLAVAGMSGLQKVPYEVAAPLLDELLACVQFMPDASNPSVVRAMHEVDVEEFDTFFVLQYEAFNLLISRFTNASPSTSASVGTAGN